MAAALPALTPKFKRSQAVTGLWEGGWSDHPADPGGKTMYGVTQAVYWDWCDRHGTARRPVRTITRDEALTIFLENYWNAVPCETLADGVDLAAYDAAVNSGVSRGRKWLLASLNPVNDHARTVKAICARRLGFVQGLRNWKTFGRGWSARIADVQAKGVAWALAAAHGEIVAGAQLQDEADAKTKVSSRQAGGGLAAGTSGGGAIIADHAGNPPVAPAGQATDWLLTGIGVLVVLGAAYLVWRAVLNRQQAAAFANQAKELRHGA